MATTTGQGTRAEDAPGLTTHMLDTGAGRPAAGVRIDLSRDLGAGWEPVCSVVTDADGRSPGPLLDAASIAVGRYELVFHLAEYFRRTGAVLADPAFLEVAVIRFGIADPAAHYHVPLLASPFAYTTYRGS